ncbi:hypothetical protein VPNG_09252 [Cytospora leucostoma]|uniref:Uncharacterized protein n=1 Tax=Cytospora leucostoma TaxID=1230097 RepID=A0A423W0N3_9PEZI|nr:hypothetical protein VPNG_09252 [Cytospora leucostoma]
MGFDDRWRRPRVRMRVSTNGVTPWKQIQDLLQGSGKFPDLNSGLSPARASTTRPNQLIHGVKH